VLKYFISPNEYYKYYGGKFMRFHGEGGIDKLIRVVFFPSRAYKGIFVEVGAADPSYLSISKHFRDSG
jgi:hypothetical protein